MTPERMRQIREMMHLPVRSLGGWTDRAESGLRQMEAGQRPIPYEFGVWLERLGRWIETNKPPAKNR
jgi:hypothetical protein